MKAYLFAFSLFCLPLIAGAQINPKSTEAVEFGVSDLDMIDRLMITVPGVGRDPRDMIQRQSVKPYMMPVRKVGARGSELSYAIATCLEYYVNLNKNYKNNLSPDYISLSLRNSGKTVNLQDAFLFLSQTGTVSAAIMPYDANSIPNAVYATQSFKITNYLHLFREVTRGEQKVFETRKALMRGNPVLIELLADSSMKNLIRSDVLKPRKGNDEPFPLIVVGYDEVEQAFEVQSCWGSSWGNGGYAWISYKDFEKFALNGYVMVPLAVY